VEAKTKRNYFRLEAKQRGLLRLLRLEAKQQISDAFEEKQANQNETKKRSETKQCETSEKSKTEQERTGIEKME
jgi:hypothetical protein